MDTVLPQERICRIYEQSVEAVMEQISGIRLNLGEDSLHKEVCTVYTSFEKSVCSGLAFCAETSLFVRLAKRMMWSEQVEFLDVEDSAKEYFNVLCGHIAAALFHDTKIAARFKIPVFYRGPYWPGGQEEGWRIHFVSDQNEIAQLIHYKAIGE